MKHALALTALTLTANLMSAQAAPLDLKTVALTGQSLPGLQAGETIRSFSYFELNDQGDTAFSGFLETIDGNTANDYVIYRHVNDSSGLVVREGTEISSEIGLIRPIFLNGFSLNGQGNVAFSTKISGHNITEDNDFATLATGENGLIVKIREGDAVPSVSDSAYISGVNKADVNFYDDGGIFFSGTVANPTPRTSNGRVNQNGNISIVLNPDNIIEVGPLRDTFSTISNFTSNSATGETVLRPRLIDASAAAGENIYALLISGPDGLRYVAQEGDQAPGLDIGIVLENLSHQGSLDSFGNLAIFSGLEGDGVTDANNNGLFLFNRDGSAQTLVRAGDSAYPIGGDVVFDSLSSPYLNDSGLTAFSARFTGSGVTQDNNRAIFIRNTEGLLGTFLRSGDEIDVGNGDLRTIATIGVTGLNNNNQIAFFAGFTDGSDGLFTASFDETLFQAQVPVPATLALLGMGLLGVGVARRKAT